jgi:hypothetical protein
LNPRPRWRSRVIAGGVVVGAVLIIACILATAMM